MHRCHANGCQADDCHPELPFCHIHFKALHPAHQKRLWAGRRQDGLCGGCHAGRPAEVRLAAAKDWHELFNLAVAILLLLDYTECGAPASMHDDHTGFCWRCGVDRAEQTYARARKAIEARI